MGTEKLSLNALIYLGFEIFNKAIPFFCLPIFTYYLTPQEMGKVAEVGAVLGVLTVVLGLSVHGAVSVAYFKLERSELPSYVFNTMLILGGTFVIGCVSYFLLQWFEIPVSDLPEKWIYFLIISATLGFVTTVNLILWQSEEKPFAYGTYQALQGLLNIGLSLVLVITMGAGWVGRVVGQVVSSCLFGLVSLGILFRRGFLRFDPRPDQIRDALKFGVPLVPHALASWVFVGFNILLIKSVLGESEAGVFSVAAQFGIILSVINAAGNRAVQPYIFKYLAELNPEKKQTYVQSIYKGFGLVLATGTIVWLGSYVVISTVIAEAFQAAKYYLALLMATEVLNGFYYLLVKPLFFANRNQYVAMTTFLAAAIHVGLASFLVRSWGVNGVLFSLFLSSFVMVVMIGIHSNRVLPLPWIARHAVA